MKNSPFLKFTLTALLLLSFTLGAYAQKKQKGVSEEDKKAILEIFKDVDKSEYRLVFGKETFGNKKIQMSDLKTVGKASSPEAQGVKWTFIAGDRSANEVIYVYTEGLSKMASLLGQNKLKALQDIAAKYDDLNR